MLTKGEYSKNKCTKAPDIISDPVPLYTYVFMTQKINCKIKPIKTASDRTVVTGRVFIFIVYKYFLILEYGRYNITHKRNKKS